MTTLTVHMNVWKLHCFSRHPCKWGYFFPLPMLFKPLCHVHADLQAAHRTFMDPSHAMGVSDLVLSRPRPTVQRWQVIHADTCEHASNDNNYLFAGWRVQGLAVTREPPHTAVVASSGTQSVWGMPASYIPGPSCDTSLCTASPGSKRRSETLARRHSGALQQLKGPVTMCVAVFPHRHEIGRDWL
jgi:hypothetical protein